MSEEMYAPADIVTGVLRFLRSLGFDARADVPLDSERGLVRVSRISGDPATAKTEVAQILIEAWHVSQPESFRFARDIWARFALVSKNDQDAFPGIICYEAIPSMPVQFPDPDRDRLFRHQFTVNMHVEFDKLVIPPLEEKHEQGAG